MSAADEIRSIAAEEGRLFRDDRILSWFDANHEAIADLIEAAEKTAQTNLFSSKASRENHINQCVYETQNALAKLNAGNEEG